MIDDDLTQMSLMLRLIFFNLKAFRKDLKTLTVFQRSIKLFKNLKIKKP